MKTITKQLHVFFLFAIFNCVTCTIGFSQDNRNSAFTEPCYFDEYIRQHKQLVNEFEQTIQGHLQKQKSANNSVQSPFPSGSAAGGLQSSNVKIIPVVVHVIHNGGTENISDAQIQSQMDVLNEDFRKMSGTNGDGNGIDSEIEFCLAKITPDGKCTNGIVRIQSTFTNHQTYQRSMLKNLSYWDNIRYLNMYVVKSINGSSGTLGYSSFPGGPPDEDGIVVRHNYFGRTGTASASLGRTTTHEISHWFGLYHTFNGGCGVDTCADGDYVCDTPPAANPNFGCPTINSCTNDVPDVNDQIQNYLDYSDDACKNMFTAGQSIRMNATLNTFRWNIWQYSNIWSTGCDSNYISPACPAVADFVSNSQNICVGNPVIFTNKSLNNPISFQWYFQGATPSSSTAVNPTVVYNSVGTYSVSLVATNLNGTDSVAFSNFITVTTPSIGVALPFSEGFETTVFPPNGITIYNPDNDITWVRDTIAKQYAGLGSAKINNLINTNYGQSDAMIFPNFNLSTFTGTPYLTFKWAYAKSDVNYSDELIVLISTDCGVNFTQLFYKTGTAMTTGTTQTTPYIPDSSTVWKSAVINLGTYATSTNAIIKIVNVTDGGNNLYIDNINIGANPTGIDENNISKYFINIFPNPTNTDATIQYTLLQSENVSIKVYDGMGKEISVLTEKKQQAGTHLFTLPLGDIKGGASSGIYFVKIIIGENVINKKIMVL